jgi:hypothetical protein
MNNKTIKSIECDGFISAQMANANSITFCATLPSNVKVEHIRLLGNIEINGITYADPYLENIAGVLVSYHKGMTEIATAYFVDGLPENVRTAVLSGTVDQFEVECVEVCPCCGA